MTIFQSILRARDACAPSAEMPACPWSRECNDAGLLDADTCARVTADGLYDDCAANFAVCAEEDTIPEVYSRAMPYTCAVRYGLGWSCKPVVVAS